jgi:hypothetical protein
VNAFLQQFSANIKFDYVCFVRVIIRGYIRSLFFEAGIVLFLRAMGFCRLTNGVMRIFTDQLNAHISKKALQNNIPILWWPSVSGGTNGAKLRYVEKRFAEQYKGKDDEVFCILTDKEPVRTFSTERAMGSIDFLSNSLNWPTMYRKKFSLVSLRRKQSLNSP